MSVKSGQIDWAQPLRVDPKDFSGPEFDEFQEITGQELWSFLIAMGDGTINEANMMVGKNRKAIYAVCWILLKREEPGLTFEQVYAQGAGIVGGEIQRRTQQNQQLQPLNTRNPKRRGDVMPDGSPTPQSLPTASNPAPYRWQE